MYAIELDPAAEQQRDALPSEGATAYMELQALREVSPWSGEPFREDKPKGKPAHAALRWRPGHGDVLRAGATPPRLRGQHHVGRLIAPF